MIPIKTPKIVGILIIVIGLPLLILDLTVLKGEVIHGTENIRLRDATQQELIVPLKQSDETHTLRLSSRKYKLMMSWTLLDPEGDIVTSETEFQPHDGIRHSRFTPAQTGDYTLQVKRNLSGDLAGAIKGQSVSVKVTKGDRQIFVPLLDALKF